MTDSLLTDDAVLARLGERLAQARLARDLTQQQLAAEAGVGKTVVERIENGKSVTLANFVRVLRVLDLLDELLRVAPEPTLRPAELAQRAGQPRRRASAARARGDASAPRTPFVWGDQRSGGAPASSPEGRGDARGPTRLGRRTGRQGETNH